MNAFAIIALFLPLSAVSFSFGQATQPDAPSVKPRVFLQAASKGNSMTAARDQAMEMSKDLERDCSGARVTINQQNADYTVLLNHIESGLFVRDNQFQLADRNGDLVTKTKEGGSIRSGMKKVYALILNEWAKSAPQAAPDATTPRPPEVPAEKPVSPPTSSAPQPSPSSKPDPVPSIAPLSANSPPIPSAPPAQQSFSNATIGAFFEGNPVVRRNGLTITAITPGGPAEQAGMKPGDVVLAINDLYLYTIRDLAREIARYDPGATIRIRYRRYTATNETTVIVGRID